MKKILIIKTSSLGDIVHTLPALTDATKALIGVRFDWVVEENYAEVPSWHPSVDEVFTVAIRRWRKKPLNTITSGEWAECKKTLSRKKYDAVIDAQGLLKSAWLTKFTNYDGNACFGLDKESARESVASWFYKQPINVAKNQLAVERTRQLFSKALGYKLPDGMGSYGLSFDRHVSNKIMLLHGTTWQSKHWPESYWQQLAVILQEAGYEVLLPWGSLVEKARAERIAGRSTAKILPSMTLTELAKALAGVKGCVSIDSGVGQLAAAVGTPTVSLFGPTNAQLTAFYGNQQLALQADFSCSPCMLRECKYSRSAGEIYPPCFKSLPPEKVFQQLDTLLAGIKNE